MPDDLSAHSVLVVDDTLSNRSLYVTLLRHAGYHVRAAANGADGLKLITERQPSIVLLDYMMPEMNGAEVLRKLRSSEATQTLPVVILTASLNTDDIEDALEAGADDYINKPVDSRILLSRVKSIIRANMDRERAEAQPERDALRRELAEAQAVQQAQLPQGAVHWPGWCAVGAVVPSGQVAGDVFDAFETADGRGISFVLDVSGHGTASALVAAETRTALRALTADAPLTEAVTRLNARMCQRETGKYSCLAAVETRGEEVTIVNAGLPPVLIWRSGSKVAEIKASGFPVGLFEDSQYEATVSSTQSGDFVVMMSDGITEPYGPSDDVEGALSRIGLSCGSIPGSVDAGALSERVRLARDFESKALRDDATVVVLEHLPAAPTPQKLELKAALSEVAASVSWALELAPTWVDQAILDTGLTEAVTNALVHGVLEVDSERRDQNYLAYLNEIQESVQDPQKSQRTIQMEVLQARATFDVRLSWSGAPCPKQFQGPRRPEPWLGHGFGSGLIHASFTSVEWSSEGRSVLLRTARAT